ncbi:hypothetical protein ACR6C2_40270 [Streptomyces sp. INA 01156]
MAQKAVLSSGSFAAEFADIEAVSAHHGNNHEVLVARFYKRDRAPMFDLVGTLEFEAVSEDRRVLDALAHARVHQSATREYVSELYEGEPLDLGFASQNWQRAVRDRRRPGMLDRRRFETLVFTYLAEHLRTGDVAVTGSDTFANWLETLPEWEECGPKLAQLYEETGLPDTAAGSPRPCASGWRPPRRRWIPGIGTTRTWSSTRTGCRCCANSAPRASARWRRRWRRRSRRGCQSGLCWASCRARRTGWSGGAGSVRPPAAPRS